MKIAFILPSLANKGPGIVVQSIVKYLTQHNIYCEVFYFTKIVELDFNCPVKKINIYDFSAIRDFDIIHSHGIRPDLYSFLNFNKSKKITTLHNYISKDLETSLGYSKLKSKLIEFIWNLFLLRMDKIIVLSKDAQKYYQNILFNKNITYIYNGISYNDTNSHIEEEEKLAKLKENGFEILGTNAMLTYRKGLHQVIKVLPYFHNIVFVIIGDGSEKKKLENLAKKLKVYDRCLFLGYKQDAKKYLKVYDYFVISSYTEGLPLALIEAALASKPIIASSISIHKEVFDSYEVSFFELDDANSLIKAIKYAKNNKSILSKNVYNRYNKNYTQEHMGSKYANLYRNILKGNK